MSSKYNDYIAETIYEGGLASGYPEKRDGFFKEYFGSMPEFFGLEEIYNRIHSRDDETIAKGYCVNKFNNCEEDRCNCREKN